MVREKKKRKDVPKLDEAQYDAQMDRWERRRRIAMIQAGVRVKDIAQRFVDEGDPVSQQMVSQLIVGSNRSFAREVKIAEWLGREWAELWPHLQGPPRRDPDGDVQQKWEKQKKRGKTELK